MSDDLTPEDWRKRAAKFRQYAKVAFSDEMEKIFLEVAANFEKAATLIEQRPPNWKPRPPRKPR
jgi:hypothetical protein